FAKDSLSNERDASCDPTRDRDWALKSTKMKCGSIHSSRKYCSVGSILMEALGIGRTRCTAFILEQQEEGTRRFLFVVAAEPETNEPTQKVDDDHAETYCWRPANCSHALQ